MNTDVVQISIYIHFQINLSPWKFLEQNTPIWKKNRRQTYLIYEDFDKLIALGLKIKLDEDLFT